MTDNGKPDNLASALAAFQADLPRIGKHNTADIKSEKGRFSYNYADLAEVSAAVLPRLASFGLSWTAMPTLVDDRFVLRYELLHTSGDSRTGTYPLPAATSPPQTLGSAITYARRYCLCAVTGVSPDEDDDGAAAQTSAETEAYALDWGIAIIEAEESGDRSAIVNLWRKAKRVRPDDTELLNSIRAAGERLKAAQETPTELAQETLEQLAERLKTKTRRELERHLFALLGEGKVPSGDRDLRLRILSKVSKLWPTVLGSMNELGDRELIAAIVELTGWQRKGQLVTELEKVSK